MNRDFTLTNWSAISCLAFAMLIPNSLFAIQDDFATFKTNLDTLTSKLESDPFNDELYIELFKLVPPHSDETKPQTDDWLRRSIVNGASNPGPIHLLLGIRAIETGKIQEGITHWSVAERHSKFSLSWLSMMLKSVATTEIGEDYENKSDLLDLAIESYPELARLQFPKARMQLAKGTFLLDENKTVEAFEQFEIAAKLAPSDTGLRETLIRIYTEQNQPEKASAHQDAIDEVVNKIRATSVAGAKEIVEFTRTEIERLQDEIERLQAESKEFKTRFTKLATDAIEDPENQETLTELAKLASPNAIDEHPDLNLWILRTIVDLEEAAAVSHIVFGIRLLDRGQKEEADSHFQVAAIHSEKAEAIIKSLLEIVSANAPEAEPENNKFRAAKIAETRKLAEEKKRLQIKLERIRTVVEEEQGKAEEFTTRFAKHATDAIEDPQNQETLTVLARFVSTDERGVPVNWILQSILHSDETAAVSHIIFGFRARRRGELQEASRHFSIAASYSEKSRVIIENLLETLSPSDPADEPNKPHQ